MMSVIKRLHWPVVGVTILLAPFAIESCTGNSGEQQQSVVSLSSFGSTDETGLSPLPPEGGFVPTMAGTLQCPPNGTVALAQAPSFGSGSAFAPGLGALFGSGSGSGPGSDAGCCVGSDAGSGSGSDAGPGSDAGSGSGSGSDAGVGSGSDAGVGSGSDAGVGSGSDAGPGSGSDGGIEDPPGSQAACTSCDATNLDHAVDDFLADPAFSSDTASFAPGRLALTHEEALKKCFTIAQYVKWKEDKFDCKQFAYYTRQCLKRFMDSVYVAAIWCKNCTNPNYTRGLIGHDVIGYYSSELGKCCLAEPSSKYPAAALVCQDATSASKCDWKKLRDDANAKYCAGTWFGDPERKTDCVPDTARGGYHDNTYTCDADTQKCLRDKDIIPAKSCVGSYRCESGKWTLKSADATQCTGTASCIGPLPFNNGACTTAGAATTFTAPCP
jgi:hypothetical protein